VVVSNADCALDVKACEATICAGAPAAVASNTAAMIEIWILMSCLPSSL